MFLQKPTRVVNKHYQPYDVYIGRGTKWGNPFIIGQDGDRLDVIRKYKERFEKLREEGVITDQDLLRLRGLRLGCFCKPKPCHGDVLAEAIEALAKQRDNRETHSAKRF